MNRNTLLGILQKVKPGIATNSQIESMGYFYFSGKKVASYNDVISIQYPIKTDFNLFVKANDLFNLISKVKLDEIEMKEDEGNLNVKGKGLNVTLAGIQDDEVRSRISSIDKSLKKAKWKKLPKNFKESINLCSFAADKKAKDNTLSCVYIKGKMCSATDNKRVAKAELSDKMKEVFIKASEISKLLAIEPKKYSITKAWIHFKNEQGCIFSLRKVEGGFPDTASLFDFKGTKVNLPTTILEGAELASIFADDTTPIIKVLLKKNKCIVSVMSEHGNGKFETKIKYKGKNLEFLINPDFLKEMMNYSTDITFSDQVARLEADNFALVTALQQGV